ncbi:alpha/beta hydrolase [Companilactobacillus sp. HBUAS59699]|uniref:alpha/beta hydrolase n=1 Tax=Companilactobacillus sp. HBUAS59699 TaxID=3109358 RepID=UPI002FEED8A5
MLAKYSTEKFEIDDGNKTIWGWILRPLSKKSDSQALIFSQGMNQSYKDMIPYAEYATSHGHTGIVFDYRDNDQEDVTSRQEDLELVVRFARKLDDVDTNKIVLMGENIGGKVVIDTANSIPDRISKLVLIHPELGLNDSKNIGKFTGPILVLHGDMDRSVPLESIKKAFESSSNAELKILKGAGHEFLGNYRNQSLKIIDQFLG